MVTIAKVLDSLGITEWKLYGEPTNETEFNSMFKKLIDGQEVSTPSDFGVTWTQISEKKTELDVSEPLADLRTERNAKLAETDWEIVMHKEKGTNIPAALKTYRQALRDITDTYTSLDDVVWPEKP
jgi:hypothetical protein